MTPPMLLKITTWFANHVTLYSVPKGQWRFGVGWAHRGFVLVAVRRSIAFHRSLAIDPEPAVTNVETRL